MLKLSEITKSKTFITTDVLEYVSNSVMIKTIIKKATGTVSAIAFDSGKMFTGKISPFDTFVQIIDGKAEIFINEESNLLDMGEFIIIPAHCRNSMRSNVRFKMLSTIIKSGYEDVS